MAITQLSHDPFARTTLMRESKPAHSFKNEQCAWCGSEPRVLYTYWNASDGHPLSNQPWRSLRKWFCNQSCAHAYGAL